MALVTKHHTEGNTTRWVVDYKKWLLPQETISEATVVSSSDTLTITSGEVHLGKEVWFYTVGGEADETPTVTITVTTTKSQIKNDTIDYVVTTP